VNNAITLVGSLSIEKNANTGVLLLSGAITNNGAQTLTVKGLDGDITISGVLGGTGALTKAGNAGNLLTLSGNNTYSGATTITTGTLQIGAGGTTGTLGSGAVTNNAALKFNRSDAQTIANAIAGSGTLEQAGTGTLTINTANTFSGATTVSAGTLQIGHASALGTGAVTNNATLDIGTTDLNIGGAYSQVSSKLKLTANSSSDYGTIISAGAGTVTGGTIDVTVNGYIPNNATLDIITTDGGLTYAAATVNSLGNLRYSFTAAKSGNVLVLTANRTADGFASDTTDSNAKAAGTVLDDITSPSSDMTTVLNTLEGLSNAQTASALDTMVPTVDMGVLNNNMAALNNFVGVSLNRAQSVLTITATGNSANTGISSGDENKLNGIWAKEYGSYLDQGTRKGIQGYKAWNAGTAIGVDRLFSDTLTLGVSGGYAYGDVDSDVNNANTYINSAQGTIYAGYQDQNIPYFIDAVGSFAWNWYNGKRDISVGAINRTANADYDGQQYGVYLDGGYKFKLGKNLELTPLASIQWNRLSLVGYTETDAGSMNLSVNRQSYDILQSGLGARVASQVKYKWGNFTPEVHVKWLYDFIGDDMAVTSTYTGGGGSFTSNGAKPAKSSVNLGGKLSFDLKNDISLIAECDTEMKDEFFGVYGSATLRYKF
jgi:autotransporter-associated beta strand protein